MSNVNNAIVTTLAQLPDEDLATLALLIQNPYSDPTSLTPTQVTNLSVRVRNIIGNNSSLQTAIAIVPQAGYGQPPAWFSSFMLNVNALVMDEETFIAYYLSDESKFRQNQRWLISQFIASGGLLMILKAMGDVAQIAKWRAKFPVLSIIAETAARDQSTFLCWLDDLHTDYDWETLKGAILTQGESYRLS